jgi:hypothetical protein
MSPVWHHRSTGEGTSSDTVYFLTGCSGQANPAKHNPILCGVVQMAASQDDIWLKTSHQWNPDLQLNTVSRFTGRAVEHEV